MLEKLCRFLEARNGQARLPGSEVIPEPDGRFHRFQVPHPPALATAAGIFVVGFFGQRRPDASSEHFGDLGERLIDEIPGHDGILSYNTMELENGNFANLVLLAEEAVSDPWRRGATHEKAVGRSPGYYLSIRIYNGELTRISPPAAIRLRKVKYWDYSSDPAWRGIRSLV